MSVRVHNDSMQPGGPIHPVAATPSPDEFTQLAATATGNSNRAAAGAPLEPVLLNGQTLWKDPRG